MDHEASDAIRPLEADESTELDTDDQRELASTWHALERSDRSTNTRERRGNILAVYTKYPVLWGDRVTEACIAYQRALVRNDKHAIAETGERLICGVRLLALDATRRILYKRRPGFSPAFLKDMLTEAFIACLKAAETLDTSKGGFSTHAMWEIRARVSRALSDQWFESASRLPVHVHDRVLPVKNMVNALRRTLDREPTDEEVQLAIRTEQSENKSLANLSLSLIHRIRHFGSNPRSIQETLGDDADSSTLGDVTPNDEAQSPELYTLAAQTLREIDRALHGLADWIRLNLAPATAWILSVRLALCGSRIVTLENIGERLGKTRERIRQLEQKATKILERALNITCREVLALKALRVQLEPLIASAENHWSSASDITDDVLMRALACCERVPSADSAEVEANRRRTAKRIRSAHTILLQAPRTTDDERELVKGASGLLNKDYRLLDSLIIYGLVEPIVVRIQPVEERKNVHRGTRIRDVFLLRTTPIAEDETLVSIFEGATDGEELPDDACFNEMPRWQRNKKSRTPKVTPVESDAPTPTKGRIKAVPDEPELDGLPAHLWWTLHALELIHDLEEPGSLRGGQPVVTQPEKRLADFLDVPLEDAGRALEKLADTYGRILWCRSFKKNTATGAFVAHGYVVLTGSITVPCCATEPRTLPDHVQVTPRSRPGRERVECDSFDTLIAELDSLIQTAESLLPRADPSL